MLEVRRDADIRVQKVVRALAVGDPALVEEDVATRQAELAGQLLRLEGHPHVRDIGVGVLEAHKEQPHLRMGVLEPVDRADEGQRVEPVVDPPAPQDHLVLRPDPRYGALDGVAGLLRGRLGDPERDDGDQRVEAPVLVVHLRVDPPLTGELPEPEVALLDRGAQQEVGAPQLVVEHPGGLANGRGAPDGSQVAGLLELLQMERVVDVRDQDRRAGIEPGRRLEQEALEDDHVRPIGQRAQRGDPDGGEDLEVGMRRSHRARGRQSHVVLGGKGLRYLPGADRRPGHPVQQRLAGDDEDALPGDEVLRDSECLDQDLVRGKVAGHAVGRLDRLAEQREQLAVAAPAQALQLAAGGHEAGKLVDEVVDGEGTGQSHFRDLEGADVIPTRRALKVEAGSVHARAGNGAAHSQRHRGGQRLREGLVVVVLVHRQQGVALEQVALPEVPEFFHRDVVAVVGERGRHVAHAVPEQVEPPPEVDVFVEHEEPLIETAHLAVEPRADEHGRTGGEQDVLRRVVGGRVGSLNFALVPHAEPGQRAVDVVDELTVPVEHL